MFSRPYFVVVFTGRQKTLGFTDELEEWILVQLLNLLGQRHQNYLVFSY